MLKIHVDLEQLHVLLRPTVPIYLVYLVGILLHFLEVMLDVVNVHYRLKLVIVLFKLLLAYQDMFYNQVFVSNVVLIWLQLALKLVLLLDFTQVEALVYLVIVLFHLVLLLVLLKGFTHLEILVLNVLLVLWLVLPELLALNVLKVITWLQEHCVLYVLKDNHLVNLVLYLYLANKIIIYHLLKYVLDVYQMIKMHVIKVV